MKKHAKESKPHPKPKAEVVHEEKREEKKPEVLKESREDAMERQQAAIDSMRLGKKPAEQTMSDKIADSRKILDVPLEPGTKLFETPEGQIIVGEADAQQVWARDMNGGKGGWANPRR